ncbi:MAG: DUF1311 domain-containing protein [Alphaproteobacteria bacterium]|jgi:uncharacterized protein YecT (DUF1311 family)|uniref:Lysozyme inhibitor LprI-like N-terminal domain-containing protein n=1 Tax=Pseudorhizobium pelagicum TaxID=1509405 RepID=A0A922NZL0_9HYPH|nr:lysozyme inhibitor LprI family protein [Pseudorhizobium pelagicum]MBU1316561.1 DUF1311 domain-containing protein [Alphaproteobacteria bacterium]KEQ06466.1 hypothetical protein GV67_24740 [Pseudorhizobium pelagicum]KEQ09622.1 hypothetical protein GV68_22475 [Pseudorhizobium pelagicum]MBU1548892.1 DUF1311 domain-containing protein [Alphaproteobacteria bacterium]MBU2335718.1 DUF1311 domain-containing protein [Alphaproteobacteria bacterium]
MATLLLPFAAQAQDPEVNCEDAQTQMEMTYCAEQDFVEADELLNAQYKLSRQATKAADADAMADLRGADAALVAAQRAWVAFRDAHCASYGYQARGGSMEPMLIYACQADLTRQRTEQLKELTDLTDN